MNKDVPVCLSVCVSAMNDLVNLLRSKCGVKIPGDTRDLMYLHAVIEKKNMYLHYGNTLYQFHTRLGERLGAPLCTSFIQD